MTVRFSHDNYDTELPIRPWKLGSWRGLLCRCPSCGKGRLFRSYLKVADCCVRCGAELHHHRADDAPPYFTIVVVGHIVVPAMLVVERIWHPSLVLHFLLWPALTLVLSLVLLPSIKGAIVGLQWALRLHGFGPEGGEGGT